MKIIEEFWGGIPLLHVAPEDNFDTELPTVVFFHGFTSAKEHNLHYAYQLARKGIRVLLPDALYHGERSENLDEVQLSLKFWEIVLTSIEELSFLHKYAEEKKLIKGHPGVAGTSMGGITTLGALTVYPWIRTAAIMMGAPNYVELAKAQMHQFETNGFKLPISGEERKQMLASLARFDSTQKRELLNQRPLFFWHGEQDTTVPFAPTFKFYQVLKEDYQDVPERLKFIREPEAGHAVSRRGMLAATEWLARHLTE
ncbi:prolyl oligopeptidase family serine peptidase [Planococcus salinus]|uniref:Esterase n=1 Tax=Planococcus salinus TaxID=1848460 RepID=A0A3M8P331_9BACL|nr:prolyl oligopeptidase family serine peptidase [Planococcus salinus]RNF38137.1 esterase [Planococcus salinus]